MNPAARWPAYYPPGVPPGEASDAAGTAFRIVRSLPPSREDFRSTFEEWTEQGKSIPADKLVLACGTSLHTELAGSMKIRARYRPLRERPIVAGTLVAAHGKMASTGSDSHITVWFYVDARPHEAFVTNAELSL